MTVPFVCTIPRSAPLATRVARLAEVCARFFEATTADRETHVHIAASLFHDIAPARELGLRSVWINRLGEDAEPEPDVELHSLTGLGAALDSLG